MSKSADAFRTISEVADWLNVPTHVLRFWESKFSQIKPVKRAGGRRYYRPKDMLIIGGIKKLLHDDGITIKGAQQIIRDQGIAHLVTLSQPLDDDISSNDDVSCDDLSAAVPQSTPQPDVETISRQEAGSESAPVSETDAEMDTGSDTFNIDDDQFDLFAPRPAASATPEPASPQPAPNLWAAKNEVPLPVIAPQYDDILQALQDADHLRPQQLRALHPLLNQIKSALDRRLG
mgnify:CR=1 FL=1